MLANLPSGSGPVLHDHEGGRAGGGMGHPLARENFCAAFPRNSLHRSKRSGADSDGRCERRVVTNVLDRAQREVGIDRAAAAHGNVAAARRVALQCRSVAAPTTAACRRRRLPAAQARHHGVPLLQLRGLLPPPSHPLQEGGPLQLFTPAHGRRPAAATAPAPLPNHCPTSTAFRSWAPARLPPLPAQFGEAGDIETSNKRVWAALAAEFLGMLLFALYGGEARDSAAAYGNGLALAVLVCECPGGWLAFR